MRPTLQPAALAAFTTVAILGVGTASAQAASHSPFAQLSSAKSGKKIVLSPTVSILPGSVKTSSNGTVTLPHSTVQVGSLSGTGVTATATKKGLVLTGGTFAMPTSVTDRALKATKKDPITVGYSTAAVTDISGTLQSTSAPASRSLLNTVIGPNLISTAAVVPATPTSAPWKFKVGVDLTGLAVHAAGGPAVIDGSVGWSGAYSLSVSLTNLAFKGGTISAAGSITGPNIFRPLTSPSIKGSVTGPVQLAPSMTLLGGDVAWGTNGLTVNGALRLACTTGSLDSSTTGTIKDAKNFSFTAKGVASSCTLGKLVTLNADTFSATIAMTAGALKYDAGFNASEIQLFTTWISQDADAHTYLSALSGKISNTCATCTGDHLLLSIGATGVAQTRDWTRTAAAAADPAKAATPIRSLDAADRTATPSYTLNATTNGAFDLIGGKLSKLSLTLSNVQFNGHTLVQSATLQKILAADITQGITAP